MKRLLRVLPAVSAALVLGVVGCGGDDGDTPPEGAVVLNEIDCHGRDWVEILSRAAAPVDLGGWVVADDPTRADHRFVLPAGTIVQPGGRLVVKQQQDLESGFPFGLKCGEDTVTLLDADGGTVDTAAVGAAPDGSSWGRLPDGTGTWQETSPTQGELNQAPVSASEALFDPGVVNTIALTLSEDSIAALTVDPYEWAEGTVQVTIGGVAAAAVQTAVRLKSGASFRPLAEKASFRLKLNEYTSTNRLLGLKTFALNAMVDDPTMMRETLAYALFREAAVPAPRTGYARVTVNGELYGLYVVVESYDDVWAEARFGSTAHVYEGMADLVPARLDEIEVDEGDKDDIRDLSALVTAIGGTDDATWLDAVGIRLDVDAFVRLWAVENYIGQFDGYAQGANNYFLHSDEAGVFTMMPWGADRAFVQTPAFPTCTRTLCTRCGEVPDCAKKYAPALASIVDAADVADLQGQAAKLATLLAAHVQEDPRKPTTVEDWQAAVADLETWLAARPGAATP